MRMTCDVMTSSSHWVSKLHVLWRIHFCFPWYKIYKKNPPREARVIAENIVALFFWTRCIFTWIFLSFNFSCRTLSVWLLFGRSIYDKLFYVVYKRCVILRSVLDSTCQLFIITLIDDTEAGNVVGYLVPWTFTGLDLSYLATSRFNGQWRCFRWTAAEYGHRVTTVLDVATCRFFLDFVTYLWTTYDWTICRKST